MDHVEAQSSKASERYLLGEMSEPERFAFEDHYFQCQECAEDVKIGAALTRGIREVGREYAEARPRPGTSRAERGTSRWWGWLSPAALLSSTAATMLAGVVIYQSVVTIPGLSVPEAVTPVVLRAAARGDEQTINPPRDKSFTAFQFDVNAAEPGAPLEYELAPAGGAPRIKGKAEAPPLGVQLQVNAPNAKLNRAGAWTLVLRNGAGQEIARYPFELKFK